MALGITCIIEENFGQKLKITAKTAARRITLGS